MNYIFILFSFFITLIPIITIGYYFYKNDTIKEPKKLLRKLFISGIISAFIVIFISFFGIIIFPTFSDIQKITNYFILFLYCFIFVSLIEELSKFIMIYYISYNNKEFDQAFDIILYSVYVGLGFAFFENIIYSLGSDIQFITIILRCITAIPAHVCFQTIMGYHLYMSKINNKKKELLLSLLIPIIFHGTYDLFVFSQNYLLYTLFIFLLLFMIIYSLSKVKKLLDIDKANLKSFCPNCGTKVNYQYCPKCGYKNNN